MPKSTRVHLSMFAWAILQTIFILAFALTGRADIAQGMLIQLGLVGILILSAGALSFQRAPITNLLNGYGSIVLLVTIGLAVPSITAYSSYVRVQGLFGNPNLLAAHLTVVGLAALSLRAKWKLWDTVLMILTVSALVLTGSRTALISYMGALITMAAVLSKKEKRNMLFTLFGALSLGALLVVVATQLEQGVNSKGPNLLTFSDELRHPAWVKEFADFSTLQRTSGDDREPTGSVFRVGASVNPDSVHPDILLVQHIGTSEPGGEYVASVYLRSEHDNSIALSTNLSETVCRLSNSWTRCVTPVGVGNGRTTVQFKLLFEDGDRPVDLELWGAQLEIGSRATAVQSTSESVLMHYLRNILQRRLLEHTGDDVAVRIKAFSVALGMITENPMFGGGIGSFSAQAEAQGLVAHHAHNLFLQIAAEQGLIGFCFLVLMLALPAFLERTYPLWQLVPMYTGLLFLNTADYTYFHAGTFYVFWFTVGLLLRRVN